MSSPGLTLGTFMSLGLESLLDCPSWDIKYAEGWIISICSVYPSLLILFSKPALHP